MGQVRIWLPVLFIILSGGNALAQGGHQTVRFHAQWLGKPVKDNQLIHAGNGFDFLRISTLRFYVSGCAFLNLNDSCSKDPHQAHLIDVFDSTRNHVAIDVPTNDGTPALCFTLGLDSVLNTSGILAGDLDPVEGMYWTWQSGFIHFKLEGECSLSGGEDRRFEYHLGGYRTPFATTKEVCMQSELPKQRWEIVIHLDRFLHPALVLDKPRLMSPGADARRLFERAVSTFEPIDSP